MSVEGASAPAAPSPDRDVRVIDRSELEKFAAARRLPEAVLAQLRARAKAEIAAGSDGTFKVPQLKRVSNSLREKEEGRSASDLEPAKEASDARPPATHQLLRSSSTPVLITPPDGALPSGGSNSFSERPSRDPSPLEGTSPAASTPSRKPSLAPLELNSITPLHKLPFTLEAHTQQGADEFHAEENQDRHCYGFDHARRLAWIGISDGHVGSGAADFVATNVVRLITSCLPKGPPSSVEDLIRGITKGVQKTEEAFRKQQDGSGACLLLACLWGETLVVANVGDSRAIIGTVKGGSIQGTLLTNDHNATNAVEAKLARFRFLKNQGLLKDVSDPSTLSEDDLVAKVKEVMEGDDIITNGRLFSSECTRTIGDFGLKKACFNVITWEPEFTVCRLGDGDHHLILGCDGVWKTVETQRAVEIVLKEIQTPSRDCSPAEKLVREAVAGGSGDDQTCVVLDLVNYRSAITVSTDIATKIFKGLSIFDNHTAQQLASSAHRTFSAKLARLHKAGGLSTGGSTHPGMFEANAKKTQAVASSVHRESRGKFDRAAAPTPYAGLSLFEAQASSVSKKAAATPTTGGSGRRLAQSTQGASTDGLLTPIAANPLSKSDSASSDPLDIVPSKGSDPSISVSPPPLVAPTPPVPRTTTSQPPSPRPTRPGNHTHTRHPSLGLAIPAAAPSPSALPPSPRDETLTRPFPNPRELAPVPPRPSSHPFPHARDSSPGRGGPSSTPPTPSFLSAPPLPLPSPRSTMPKEILPDGVLLSLRPPGESEKLPAIDDSPWSDWGECLSLDQCVRDLSRLVIALDGVAVGTVSWHSVFYGPNAGSRSLRVGISLLPSARGRGVGSSAQRLLALHLFATTATHRLEACTDVTNVVEQRSLEKAGFVREGILRGAQFRTDGVRHDLVMFSILRSDVAAARP